MQTSLPHGTSYGEAFFDLSPQLPCTALFLDPSNALLLMPSSGNDGTYLRIGVAKFLRTEKQRGRVPMVSVPPRRFNRVPFGPISAEDETAVVTIVCKSYSLAALQVLYAPV